MLTAMISPRLRNWTLAAGFALVLLGATACSSATAETTAHDEEHDHAEAPAADQLREWTGSTAPHVTISVLADGILDIAAPGFTFTPASVVDPVPGEGHAHLYVDGEMVTMIYKPSSPLPRLDPGDHVLMVTLSTNDHLEYSSDGKLIAGMTTVEITDG